jgi:TonB family protein
MRILLIFIFVLNFLIVYAQKTDVKLRANNWKVTSLAGRNVPEGLKLIFKFSGAQITIGSEYNREICNYVADKKNIIISNKGKKETWKIIKLNKNELVFTDEKDALVELVKTDEDLPNLNKDKDNLFLPPPPPEEHITETEITEEISDPEQEPEIFTIVEVQPSFPGCENINDVSERQRCSDKKMVMFLAKNAGYPETAREAGFEGSVFVRFIVETDGSITNIEVLKDQTPGGGLKEAALAAVEAMNDMPKRWNPGMQRGKPVRVRVVVPLKFKLTDDGPKIYSIETDYKVKGKEAKLLHGEWKLTSLNSFEIPESDNMRLEFKSNSDLIFSNNQGIAEKSNWKLSKDSKKIEIKDSETSEPDLWGIKVLNEDEVIFMDAKMGEMRLKRKK